MKKNSEVKMVPLETFIDLLIDVYNEGYDFVDIKCSIDEESGEHHINVSIIDDYLSKDLETPPATEDDYLALS